MATKKKATNRVKGLKAKSLTAKNAKNVKGGTESVTSLQTKWGVGAAGDGSVNKVNKVRGY